MADNFGMRFLLREVVNGYIFWTLFQALAPMIWFYPLNELEISGYEAFSLLLFSPLLLGVPVVRHVLNNQFVLTCLRLLSVISLGSFQTPTTLMRLVTLSAGVSIAMLLLTVSLFSQSSSERCNTVWGLMLGLLTFLSSRIWYTSFVPAWWDAASNSVIIAVGVVAVLDKSVTDKPVPLNTQVAGGANWIIQGAGLGSLLYITQAVYGEVSLVSRWVVKGYPETGPSPYPWGAAILLALWLGLAMSPCSHVTGSVVWSLIGGAACAALYCLPTWQGFSGGLVVGVYVMSVWPRLLDGLVSCPPARTMSLAALVWLVEVLFSVWTVAYNFVPGGVYTRERTGLLLIFTMTTISAAVLFGNRSTLPSQTCFIRLPDQSVMPNRKTMTVLALIVLAGLMGFVPRHSRQVRYDPMQRSSDQRTLTAAIWTYHFGYDNTGWPSLERSASLLSNTGADVITLLESDASKPFLGNNDLGCWLAERMGMYVDFGPSTRDHTWGNLLLSKYPIVNSTHHLLPSPHGELAPAISATVNVSGQLVDLVVTHMGNDRDVLDRKLQAEYLSRELKNAQHPVIFLGYVTSAPFSRDYRQLIGQGNVKDIDSTDDDRWCEYIMYRGLIRVGYARISHGGLSDTEVQVARFQVPGDGDKFTDHETTVTDPTLVDPKMHFSKKFGSFARGHNWALRHRYHMSTPKYFLP